MKSEKLTVAAVEKAIGMKAAEWSGNCYAVACAILRARMVKGRPAYGHWLGEVHRDSPFARDGKRPPIVRHGWIAMKDGSVIDPTRWVFEAAEPYIWHGMPPDDPDCEDCGYKEFEHDEDDDSATCSEFRGPRWPYDEGGDRLRAATQRPFPQVGPGEPVCVRLLLPSGVLRRLGISGQLTRQQAAWVANLPFSKLGRDAWAVCVALDAAGCRAYVPIDTWTRAEAERGL